MKYLYSSYFYKAKAPCKECSERTIACHGKCEKYKNFTEKLSKEKALCEDARKKEISYNDFKIKNAIRNKKT